MKRNLLVWIVAGYLITFVLLIPAFSNESPETDISSSVILGATITTNSNSDLVKEYSYDDEWSPVVGVTLLYIIDGIVLFEAEGMFSSNGQQNYPTNIDYRRIFGITGNYQQFFHQLQQDNLLYLQATSAAPSNGAHLWHSYEYAPDWDVNSNQAPEHDFGIEYSEFQIDGVQHIPQIPSLEVGIGQRTQKRVGYRQVMGMSKCSSCHIVAHDKDIDETTSDVTLYIKWERNRVVSLLRVTG